jgi:glycosyltransferase involved in cell wall biosynthesis
LESAVSQDYPSLEVVVADDGSSDGTYEIVQDYASRFPGRIRALPQSVNRGIDGIIDNANRALLECRGEFVAFLEGDDLFCPTKIRQQVEWMTQHAAAVLCGHDVEIFDSGTGEKVGLCSDRRPLRGGVGPRDVIRNGVPFCTASVMVRRSAMPPGGFDSRLRMVLDWKLWIDVLTPNASYGFIPAVLSRYRRHASGVTSQSERAGHIHAVSFLDLLVTVAAVEATRPDFMQDCEFARGRLFSAEGIWHLERGNVDAARRCLWRAMKARNAHVRRKVPFWWGLTFLPPVVAGRIIRRRAATGLSRASAARNRPPR